MKYETVALERIDHYELSMNESLNVHRYRARKILFVLFLTSNKVMTVEH